jgi:hypothetical protein
MNMETLISRQSLLEHLENVLAVEMKARAEYDADTHTFANFRITDTIRHIRDDEDRHIAMLVALVAMLKKEYQRAL